MKNKNRAEEMAQVLEAQAASGLSKKAFCEAHGIAPSMFYYWQKRLGEPGSSPEAEPGFTQLAVQPPAELEVRLPGGHWVGVRASSAAALGLFVEAISQAHA